jgi:phosphomannomutase/phosphoglucomutase
MRVAPEIFRLYDIRGIAGDDFTAKDIAEYEHWYGSWPGVNITPTVARAIGQAFATFMIRKNGVKTMLVGHEQRPNAEAIKTAFISGVRATGCDVVDAGISLTPVIYFASCHGSYDAAVNITGSHNVACYNGFKLMGRGAWPIWGADLQIIRQMIERDDFVQAETAGSLAVTDCYPEYKTEILRRVQLNRHLKIIVDTGNGSAGLFAGDFFRGLGCEVKVIYEAVDPSFPNHVPDPEDPASLVELGKEVVAAGADLGIGIDADGDRVGAVDEQGGFIDADTLLMIFAQDVLTRQPGKIILHDIKTSNLIDRQVVKWGGRTVTSMTGHAPIKEAMRRDRNIILSGEMSGHIFFTENYYGIDDGLYAAARLLEIVSRAERPISKIFNSWPTTVRTPEIKLPCRDQDKFKIVEHLQKHFESQSRTIVIDGAKVMFDDESWALVRAANTAPYLSLRLEAETLDRLLEIKNILADALEQYPEIGDQLNRQAAATNTGRLGWV